MHFVSIQYSNEINSNDYNQKMKKLMDYVAEATTVEEEVMSWDMKEVLEGVATPLILDIREPYEFDWKLDCAAGTITKYRW